MSASRIPSGGIAVVVVIPFFRDVFTRSLSKSISCSDNTLCGLIVAKSGTNCGGGGGGGGVCGVRTRRDISRMPEV